MKAEEKENLRKYLEEDEAVLKKFVYIICLLILLFELFYIQTLVTQLYISI